MINCRTCQKSISTDAKICPGCGAEKPNLEDFILSKKMQMLFGAFLTVLPIIGAILSATTENFGIREGKWAPLITVAIVIAGVATFLDAKKSLNDPSK